MKKLICTFLITTCIANAQNTITFNEGDNSPAATLQDVSWIAGHWKGEAFGGVVEEIWSPPLGDSMMFVFKMVSDGSVGFYEIGHIREIDKTLILQLKHFHGDLRGWEERDETVDFKLVQWDDKRVYFDNFTFEKVSDNEINLYVVISQQDGSENEVQFNYKRQN